MPAQDSTCTPVNLGDVDEALRPYLEAVDPAAEERRLEELIAGVEEGIRRIIRRKLQLYDTGGPRRGFAGRDAEMGEDLYCATVLRLVEKLLQLKESLREGIEAIDDTRPAAPPVETDCDESAEDAGIAAASIRNFRGLAEVVTRNLLHEHLRQKYPRRASLQNQLLYIIHKYRDPDTHQPRYALWPAERERLCGFVEWTGRGLAPNDRFHILREDPFHFARQALPHGDSLAPSLVQLFDALLRWVGTPVEFDEAVTAIAKLRGVEEAVHTSLHDPDDDETGNAIDPRDATIGPEEKILLRDSLTRLWAAVRELPPRQAASLLLNLTDRRGGGVIDLLPALRIASVREIAATVGMPAEQLAELWPRLPLEDSEIAKILECPTVSVTTWRFRARRRLAAAAAREHYTAERQGGAI